MHLSWYVSNQLELYLYSKYVLELELSKSTLALGAYDKGRLVGFLFAQFKNEPKVWTSWPQQLFLKAADKIIDWAGYRDTSDVYDQANQEMLANFTPQQPDGELTFFAVDPRLTGKKIGTRLLARLEEMKRGQLIYLYTDSGSTYQFYLRRGFEVFEQRELELPTATGKVPLTCFLMSRKL